MAGNGAMRAGSKRGVAKASKSVAGGGETLRGVADR